MTLETLLSRPAILFDLFHTLTSQRQARLSGPQTHELLQVSRAAILKAVFEESQARLTGGITDPVEIIADIARRSGSPVAVSEYPGIARNNANRFYQSLRRISPAVLDALDALRATGKRLALVSNADVMEADAFAGCPLASRFHSVHFSCYEGVAKPDPGIYERALSALGVRSQDAFFVGDGGSNEFAGARAVGLPSVCTTEFLVETMPEKIPERSAAAALTIASLDELCSALGAA